MGSAETPGAGIDARPERTGADAAPTAPSAGAPPGSWEEVERRARGLLSEGEPRRAFRVAMSYHSAAGDERSARFLREECREAPLSIVLAMVQGIGNMVMLTPAVRALKDVFPRSHLEVVGIGAALGVVRGWDLVQAATELGDFDPGAEWDLALCSIWSGPFQGHYGPALARAGVPVVAASYGDRERHEAEFHLDLALWRAASAGLLAACREEGVTCGVWCQNVQYPPERTSNSVLRRADFVLGVTPYLRIVLRERFSRTHDVYVISNAAGDEFFDAFTERSGTRMARFLFFGRLSEAQKGVLTLCDALAALKEEGAEFTLDVIGAGPDEDLMRTRIGTLDLGEEVRLGGWMPAAELARGLADYDLCILPSRFEACSLAVLECMAAGMPLITTAVGGTPWLVAKMKHGVLVPPDRPDMLAQAIRWAQNHPPEMNLMGRWAHKKALKRYHWARVVNDFGELLARVHVPANAGADRLQAG